MENKLKVGSIKNFTIKSASFIGVVWYDGIQVLALTGDTKGKLYNLTEVNTVKQVRLDVNDRRLVDELSKLLININKEVLSGKELTIVATNKVQNKIELKLKAFTKYNNSFISFNAINKLLTKTMEEDYVYVKYNVDEEYKQYIQEGVLFVPKSYNISNMYAEPVKKVSGYLYHFTVTLSNGETLSLSEIDDYLEGDILLIFNSYITGEDKISVDNVKRLVKKLRFPMKVLGALGYSNAETNITNELIKIQKGIKVSKF